MPQVGHRTAIAHAGVSLTPDPPPVASGAMRKQGTGGFTAATIDNDDFRLLGDNLPTLERVVDLRC